jgi:hypothetical protein
MVKLLEDRVNVENDPRWGGKESSVDRFRNLLFTVSPFALPAYSNKPEEIIDDVSTDRV